MEYRRHKILWIIYCLLCGSFVFFAMQSNAQEFPKQPESKQFVNDYANLLKPNEVNLLETKLQNYEKETSTQIVIVIKSTIGNYAIAQYSVALAEKWGIGQKGKNNGILIFISKEQRKIFIATGYGVEAKLTDFYAKKIIESVIKPNFKNGAYYLGLDTGINRIIEVLKGEFTNLNTPTASNKQRKKGGSIFSLLIFLLIFFGPMLLTIINIIRYRHRSYYGSRNPNIYGTTYLASGLGSPGSSFTSFSSGGGSFGGFGGGSFGGGGAGGSW